METWNASHGGWPAGRLRPPIVGSVVHTPGHPTCSGQASGRRSGVAAGVSPRAVTLTPSMSTANRNCTVQMLLLSSSA